MTNNEIISKILNREGSKYTNHPSDRGGPTKYGITLATLRAWRPHAVVTPISVQELSEEEARDIYLHNYILNPGYDKLANPELTEQLVDAGVQHGVTEAIRILQRALRVPADGVLGSATIAAHDRQRDKAVIRFLASRMRYYGMILNPSLNKRAESQWCFSAGWFNRVAGCLDDLADH